MLGDAMPDTHTLKQTNKQKERKKNRYNQLLQFGSVLRKPRVSQGDREAVSHS